MSSVDPQLKALQDEIFLSKVARARRTPMSEKLAAGALLFDQNMHIMRAMIQSEHPEYTAGQVDQELDRRLKITKLLDDGNIYRDAGTIDEQP